MDYANLRSLMNKQMELTAKLSRETARLAEQPAWHPFAIAATILGLAVLVTELLG